MTLPLFPDLGPGASLPAPRRQRLLGQWPTPCWFAEALIETFFADLGSSDLVVEPCAGEGNLLGAIGAEIPVVGVEIDPCLAAVARARTGRVVHTGDICTADFELFNGTTAVITNPPFQMRVVDAILDGFHPVLPDGGRIGLLLPASALQTAARVSRYSCKWAIRQELVPRNVFPGLSSPLLFAVFTRARKRTLVGFALFRDVAEIRQLPALTQKHLVVEGPSPVWRAVVDQALTRLGDEADLDAIYAEVEGHRTTANRNWHAKVRQQLHLHHARVGPSRYRRRFDARAA